jgi:hypothetical protein
MPDVDATLADARPRIVQQLANTLEDSVLTKVRVTSRKVVGAMELAAGLRPEVEARGRRSAQRFTTYELARES